MSRLWPRSWKLRARGPPTSALKCGQYREAHQVCRPQPAQRIKLTLVRLGPRMGKSTVPVCPDQWFKCSKMRCGGVRCGGVSFGMPLAPFRATRNSKEIGPNSVAMACTLVTAPGLAHLAEHRSPRRSTAAFAIYHFPFSIPSCTFAAFHSAADGTHVTNVTDVTHLTHVTLLPIHRPHLRYTPNSLNASHIAMIFSGGTSAWMLWTVLKMNPPPGAKSSMRRFTSSRTSCGVPCGSTCCVSTPPP